MNIPPLDLKRQYKTIKADVMKRIEGLCDQQTFILGPAVEQFEKEMAQYLGVKHAIGVASGTDAIMIALMALDLKAGDEVIATPFTFIATAEPIALLGATPVFVDIDPKTFNIDPKLIEAKITRKTKAIIAVHLYGQTADMESILAIAKKHALPVIEDTAQAMGGVCGTMKKQAGTMGTIGCYSFFPSKNLGCFGDGGLVSTNDDAIAKKLKMVRVHGSERRYYHDIMGINGRLDAIQAVVLSVKLPHLNSWVKARAERAANYNNLIARYGLSTILTVPYVAPGNFHSYHQYTVIVAEKRDQLFDHLVKQGIGANVYYPVPLHEQNSFKYLGYKQGSLPNSEQLAKKILSLPIFPEITDEEQTFIIETIRNFYK